MQHYRFPCGCSFPVLAPSTDPDILPLLDLDFDKIDFDCKDTWELLGKGSTKGVFQLESNLGRKWTKLLKPEHINHLAALGAILRPGVLRSIDSETGKSLTELYCLRKNDELPVVYIHDCLKPILEKTYGILVFQEQAMQIAQLIAGFNLQEADELRKAIGKKLAEEMAKVKTKFFEGADRVKMVSREQAEEIFGWIEKSQRYSFNASHAVSYGINGYISAYLKCHFPLQFFTSWLYYGQFKSEPQIETRLLVNDAKLLGVEVATPDICQMEPQFSTDGKIINFGITNIKGIGDNSMVKINSVIKDAELTLKKPISMWSWFEFLLFACGPKQLSTTVVNGLISVGGLRRFDSCRNKMLNEYKRWMELTDGEQLWIIKAATEGKVSDLISALEAATPTKANGGAAHTERRSELMKSMADLLKNPPSPIQDTASWIAFIEEFLLGISITCSKVDSCDTSMINCTCKELLAGRTGYLLLGVEVNDVREIKTKNGKQAGSKMAFVAVSDSSCSLDMVVFPDAWRAYSLLLTPKNTVAIEVKPDKAKESYIINKVYQI